MIHAAGTAALEAGVTPGDVLDVCGTLSVRVPVVLMVYANVVLRRRRRGASPGEPPTAGRGGSDRPGPAAGRGGRGCARLATRLGIALVPLVAPSSAPERVAEIGRRGARLRLRRVAGRHDGRARRAPAGAAAAWSSGSARPRASRSLSASGSRPADQAAAVGELADGVIVGSRMVRAAGEGGAEAVGAVVAELAEALAATS